MAHSWCFSGRNSIKGQPDREVRGKRNGVCLYWKFCFWNMWNNMTACSSGLSYLFSSQLYWQRDTWPPQIAFWGTLSALDLPDLIGISKRPLFCYSFPRYPAEHIHKDISAGTASYAECTNYFSVDFLVLYFFSSFTSGIFKTLVIIQCWQYTLHVWKSSVAEETWLEKNNASTEFKEVGEMRAG